MDSKLSVPTPLDPMLSKDTKATEKRHMEPVDKKPASKKQRREKFQTPKPEYIIQNGYRLVKPYVYEYQAFAKERWYQRELFDVLTTEFGAYTSQYYDLAVRSGRVTVNHSIVSPTYRIKNGDFIVHRTHRHEPPVSSDHIPIVYEDDELLVVSKPCSIPTHPCGAYRHNSLHSILLHQIPVQTSLHVVHRLDRLTSGIVIFAKTAAAAKKLSTEMTKRQVHKTYLAGVKGFIPSQWDEGSKKQQNEIKERAKQICEASEITFSEKQIRVKCPLKCLSHKNGVWECHKDGKESETIFEWDQLIVPVDNQDVSCVLRCFPVTGRTHQIRLHLQLIGLPIANDPCYGGELHFGSKTALLDTKDKKESLPDERNTKDGQELYQHVGENMESYMRRICQRCQDQADITAYNEIHEHCSGIWLHALEYEIDNKKFTAPLPSWACQL